MVIKYVRGVVNRSADCLSRLPIPEREATAREGVNEYTYVNLVTGNVQIITADVLSYEMGRDETLSLVRDCINNG